MGLARQQRRAFYTRTAGASLEDLVKLASVYCRRASWPLSGWERQIEAEALAFHRNREPIFHGGVAGLKVGERLLPGAVTGANPHNGTIPTGSAAASTQTPTQRKAERYAEDISGTVYRVALEGTSGLDILDVRVLALIWGSPQMKRWHRVYGDRARTVFFGNMPVTLTADSATILEVLS